MKILIFLLLGVSLSEQSFWFERAATNANLQPTETVLTSTADHRFIVNILKYKVENGTESPTQFACLGTLITEDYAVVPADCVNLPNPYRFAIQFVINEIHTNEIGPSIILKRLEIEIHDNYTVSDKEINNIALVKFFPQGISFDPPVLESFAPIARSYLPQLSHCSVIGTEIHLSSPPGEKVLVNGPGCCGTSQTHCTVFEDSKHDACRALHGAPVICNGQFAGFALRINETCVVSSGRVMIKYHSVGSFKDWIDYYAKNLQTTTKSPLSGTASSIKLSISFLIFIVTLITLN